MTLTVNADLDKSSLEAFVRNYFANKCPTTYQNGKIHCMAGRRRSFGDLLILCKSYFDCTEKELAKILIEMWKAEDIAVLYCSGTHILTFAEGTDDRFNLITHIHPRNYIGVNGSDMYNKPENVGLDGYSFNKIYELAHEPDN